MRINRWQMGEETATYLQLVKDPKGTTKKRILLSARKGEIPAREVEQMGQRTEPPEEMLRCICIRMILNGEPVAEIMVEIEEGEEEESLEKFARENDPETIIEDIEQLLEGTESETPAAMLNQKTAEMEDMRAWPNTPSPERYIRARRTLQRQIHGGEKSQGPGENPDMEQVASIAETTIFGEWAIMQMADLGVKEWHWDYRTMETFAWAGDTWETIGMAVNIDAEENTSQKAMGVTRLQRDPEWIGFNPILGELKGAQAMVLESETAPGKPGIVMASINGHPEAPELEGATREFPPGEASILKKLMEWHGVKQCLWIPRR